LILIKLLSFCASPVPGSSTEVLLRRIAASISRQLNTRSCHDFIRLSDYDITPCQSCGEAPTPGYCFIDDGMTELYRKLEKCDCLLFGSPIYFDSVSASAKLFIDRCNCIRPYDFQKSGGDHRFVKLIQRQKPGAIILVGGEKAWFEGARRCIAGFFKWVEVTNEALIMHHSVDAELIGDVSDKPETLHDADEIGRRLAMIIRKNHARR
jgi:multimeric flavodoxin WrbA